MTEWEWQDVIFKGKRECHRCKTDLGMLIDIEKQAGQHLEAAKAAFVSKDFRQMLFHAKRACALRRTPEAAKMLACASLLMGQFDLSLASWRGV
jgi:hypothetical protein